MYFLGLFTRRNSDQRRRSEKRNTSVVCVAKRSCAPVAWQCTAEHTVAINLSRASNADRRLLKLGT